MGLGLALGLGLGAAQPVKRTCRLPFQPRLPCFFAMAPAMRAPVARSVLHTTASIAWCSCPLMAAITW